MNWGVETYTTVTDKKTKEERLEWELDGYYGDNLKLAAEQAIVAGCKEAKDLKEIIKHIELAKQEVKECLRGLKIKKHE